MKVTIKTPEPVKPNVVIELTNAEALVVLALLGKTVGRAGRVDPFPMYDALAEALATRSECPEITTGVIRFAEDDK